MNDFILVKPSAEMREKIWEYRQEFLDNNEVRVNGSCGILHYDNFDEWLEYALAVETKKFKNGVHASTFFSVRRSDNRIIGSIQVRHSLTEELRQSGGHIGYGIRPSERRKGYGKQQLQLGLKEAKHMGLNRVLITCEDFNKASAQTAIACRGILSGESVFEGKTNLLFWIDLK